MLYRTVIAIILFCLIGFQGQAQKINEPEITLPHNQFEALYVRDKVLNPLCLKGKITSVVRTFIQHVSPYSTEEYIEYYNYKLNSKHEIVDYSSNLEYDETEAVDLNLIPVLSVKNDTVIEKENIKYRFKKGLLVLKEERNTEMGYFDSLVFQYKNNNLSERLHFASQGMYESDDEGFVDESYMIYGPFETQSYIKVTYTAASKIETYLDYEVNLDIASTFFATYKYNSDGSLKNYTMLSNEYYADKVDAYQHPTQWVFRKEDALKETSLETKGSYTYDAKGRIISHKITKSNNENEYYKVLYTKKGYLIQVSRDYYNNYEELVHEDLEYEYIFDSLNNPIEVYSYVIENEEKIIDKSNTLEIQYSEK
ncbi:hypothetical protein [Lacinutrix jangbogonensis]|uniref:hypothetical protein n=1 Tax=Lacinutrix jangbogonensis TaxID=1469557 RepID=UPI00053D31C1|nr:hypothetical protein [Lacinutrix jangbogonensis]